MHTNLSMDSHESVKHACNPQVSCSFCVQVQHSEFRCGDSDSLTGYFSLFSRKIKIQYFKV